ncbi:MAG: branched-chain amino acid transport system permease protein [Candidatus Peregrinibacteria bacterium Greene0416_19]|nr:MAG: branched-chain amino acid transport system permease protein [Candidatus Peregrinibacteria bacterium Greene0416_19]
MDFFWHMLFITANWVPLACAYTLMLGRGRILNWGPIGVGLVAAYAIFIVQTATGSYVLGAVAGLALTAAVSLLYAWLALRLRDDAFGVMAIAVHLGLIALVLNWPSLTRGALGIPRIARMPGLESTPAFALLALVIAVVWVLALLRIDRGAFGRNLQAMGEQEWNATAIGVSRTRVYVIVFLLLGLALWTDNLLFPQYLRLLHPNDYQFPVFVFLITIVVAGRPGSVRGAALATALLVPLREGLRFLPFAPGALGPLRLILFGVILFAAVWWRRETLFPVQRSV